MALEGAPRSAGRTLSTFLRFALVWLLPWPEVGAASTGNMPCPVPHRQDLDQLRRQAKEPRHAARGGEPTAVQRSIR